MKKDYFKQNPHLIEFAKKVTSKQADEASDTESKKGKKKKSKTTGLNQQMKKKRRREESKLKWGRPFFGIYDRYGSGTSNHDKCWMFAGPGNDRGVPQIGQYFQTDEPLRVERKGKYLDWVQRVSSVHDSRAPPFGPPIPIPKKLIR